MGNELITGEQGIGIQIEETKKYVQEAALRKDQLLKSAIKKDPHLGSLLCKVNDPEAIIAIALAQLEDTKNAILSNKKNPATLAALAHLEGKSPLEAVRFLTTTIRNITITAPQYSLRSAKTETLEKLYEMSGILLTKIGQLPEETINAERVKALKERHKQLVAELGKRIDAKSKKVSYGVLEDVVIKKTKQMIRGSAVLQVYVAGKEAKERISQIEKGLTLLEGTVVGIKEKMLKLEAHGIAIPPDTRKQNPDPNESAALDPETPDQEAFTELLKKAKKRIESIKDAIPQLNDSINTTATSISEFTPRMLENRRKESNAATAVFHNEGFAASTAQQTILAMKKELAQIGQLTHSVMQSLAVALGTPMEQHSTGVGQKGGSISSTNPLKALADMASLVGLPPATP